MNIENSKFYIENSLGIKITTNTGLWHILANKYGISPTEIAQIDFNRSGLCLPNNEVKESFRTRFKAELFQAEESWFALPVRSPNDTNFIATNGKLFFGNEIIGQTGKLLLDTYESSYQRGPHLLNLNSRSRSNCGGCKACVHNYKTLYDDTVIKDNLPLNTVADICAFFDDKNIDVPNLTQIAVVTGLFGSEENAVEHMNIVNKAAKAKGFRGELMYFGCEVNSPTALDKLAKIDNFAIIYALDNFTKRDKILAKSKSSISIDTANQTLFNAKNRGIQTTIAYISGIDAIDDMSEGFKKIQNNLTRFPVINIYQVQTPGQTKAFEPAATQLEYYVKSRVILEDVFTNTELRPRRWENYRPLWYQSFAGETLPSNSYGEKEHIAVNRPLIQSMKGRC